jgi:hypothetical protein
LKPGQEVTFDVEKVQCVSNEQVPGYVVVYRWVELDERRRRRGKGADKVDAIVYSAKVRVDDKTVKDYLPEFSGLTKMDLDSNAVEFKDVREKLIEIFKDRKIYGMGLEQELKCFNLHGYVRPENRFEFMKHFTDINNQPIAIKTLAYAFFKVKIQEYKDDYDPLQGHDPCKDCQLVARIYRFKDRDDLKAQNGSYEWCRDIVNEAIENGEIRYVKPSKRKR